MARFHWATGDTALRKAEKLFGAAYPIVCEEWGRLEDSDLQGMRAERHRVVGVLLRKIHLLADGAPPPSSPKHGPTDRPLSDLDLGRVMWSAPVPKEGPEAVLFDWVSALRQAADNALKAYEEWPPEGPTNGPARGWAAADAQRRALIRAVFARVSKLPPRFRARFRSGLTPAAFAYFAVAVGRDRRPAPRDTRTGERLTAAEVFRAYNVKHWQKLLRDYDQEQMGG